MKNQIGIGDASENDTNMLTDWKVAKSRGISFGIVRATTTGAWVNGKPQIREDAQFHNNSLGMLSAQVKRMSYGWFDPRYKVCPPVAQADSFLASLHREGIGELGPMIDAEDEPAAGIYGFVGVGQYIKQWFDEVEAVTKVKPRMYTNLSYVQNYLFNSQVRETWLFDYGLVIANWGLPAPYVPMPWGPGMWDAWQFTASAPGSYYGFPAAIAGKAAPSICLAVWNGELPVS
jgi:GH25 family lysozyme M1 (1,4-beta-N-acetylmuramidase)